MSKVKKYKNMIDRPTEWRGLLQQKSGFPPHLLLQKQESWEPWEVLETLLKPISPPFIGATFLKPNGVETAKQ